MIHEFRKRKEEGKFHSIKYSQNEKHLFPTHNRNQKMHAIQFVNIQTRIVRTTHTHILGKWNSNENHSFGSSSSYCSHSLSWSIMLWHSLFLLLSLLHDIEGKKWCKGTGREQLRNIYPTIWWHFFNTSYLFHIMHSLQPLFFPVCDVPT